MLMTILLHFMSVNVSISNTRTDLHESKLAPCVHSYERSETVDQKPSSFVKGIQLLCVKQVEIRLPVLECIVTVVSVLLFNCTEKECAMVFLTLGLCTTGRTFVTLS